MVELRVFRSPPGRYDVFEVEEREGMTVLEALFKIREEIDGSLAFRYSCRGAVCGSCAVLINRIPRLACRTQVRDAKSESVLDLVAYGPYVKPAVKTGGRILVEPLPSLPVIKDLVVDLDRFLGHYESIEPWMSSHGNMSLEEMKQTEVYANCILCAACYGACPVASRDRDFLGPAALAKSWRFCSDTRNSQEDIEKRIEQVDTPWGVWGCDTVYKCTEVCPKEVPPTLAITAFRRKILVHRSRKLAGRLVRLLGR